MPIDQLQHVVRVASREHHHKCRTSHRCPRQIQAGEEAGKDRYERDANKHEQTALQFWNYMFGPINCRLP